jgi:hypothetical protein
MSQINFLKILLAISIFFLPLSVGYAELSKVVNLSMAGTLSAAFSATEKTSVTRLSVTGILNADDIYFMHSDMRVLAVIDMSGATITNGSIPYCAFSYNEGRGMETLDSIFLPSNTVSIGQEAFTSCINLKYVEFPSTVRTIEGYAFMSCTGMNSLTLPSSLDSVGTMAFYNCTGLTSVTIPSSLKYWDEGLFRQCTGLTSVIFTSGLKSIGEAAFSECSALTSLTVPSSVEYIGIEAFSCCTNLQSVSLSNTLDTIASCAFYSCSALSSLFIPASVRSIGMGAFYKCGTVFTVDPASQYFSLSDGILFNKDKTSLILFPFSRTGVYTIPESVKTLATGAFISAEGLTAVELPAGLTSIGSFSFCGCSGLSSLHLPASLSSIDGHAFSGSSIQLTVDPANLYFEMVDSVLFNKDKSILFYCPISKNGVYQLPETVDSIAVSAFYCCANLTSLIFPQGLTGIGESALYDCDGITSIYFSSPFPPRCTWDMGYIDDDVCVLYVPKGSKSYYEEADVWGYYNQIYEWDVPTAISPVEAYAGIALQNGMLQIKGVNSGETVSVFNLEGRNIFSRVTTAPCDINVALPDRGTYLVRIGRKCVKEVY